MYFLPDIERSVNDMFNLPNNLVNQDWPLEVSDSSRIHEFLVSLETNPDRVSNDIKIAIMALILASYDDYINEDLPADSEIERRIIQILSGNISQYKELIFFWSSEDTQDPFAISYLLNGLI